ncbi:hypothetical protein BN946_scf185039.g5 [Trametes cinnabarina]|uniref:Uncharacterized protein n=1 Tax=Pycnoporus cinnabarinus TaxID=5643 RepID=A0A060SU82_PYCCI|nr:hypothetical protein BN946_scf185039.g5 [Trametes cinnabarina]
MPNSTTEEMGDDAEATPPSRLGLIQLPANVTRVTDADEEVFLLYTDLIARKAADGSSGFRGLGHIDSHEDTLAITLNLGVPEKASAENSVLSEKHASARGSHKKKVRGDKQVPERTLEVLIYQDKTALRSRKGDTGSVVWHASAGTGLLAVVLAPFARRYTVTDIDDLVPLIRKNVSRNSSSAPPSSSKLRSSHSTSSAQLRNTLSPPPSNVTAVPLDWTEIHNASPTLRRKIAPQEPADLLLVVDCIYHPSLIPPLLSTIDCLTMPDRTVVLVVVELRAENVVREFLQGWLDLSPPGVWEIWSVGGFMEGPYAIWAGWKHKTTQR